MIDEDEGRGGTGRGAPGEQSPPPLHSGVTVFLLRRGAAVALVLLACLFGVIEPAFLGLENLTNILMQASVLAILAVGMTFVIVAAEIDLSVGALLALAGVVFGLSINAGVPGWLAVGLTVLIGAGVGTLNGAGVAFLGVPSFVVTLGMMGIARGVALLTTDGRSIVGFTGQLLERIRGDVLFIPVPFLIALGVGGAGYALLQHTPWGRETVAIGSNREAAWLAGVPIRGRIVFAFAFSGATAGLASIVLTARLDAAQPTAGIMYELDAIAAAVIGGSSLLGGRGGVVGSLVGAVLIATLRNGLNIVNLSSYTQPVAIGALIIAAVALDQIAQRQVAERILKA